MKTPIILTTGKFHILHPGHVELFEYCSTLGTVFVGINTDDYILKEHGTIFIPLEHRIYILNSIKYIDKVLTFSEKNACELIKRIKPDYFIKGPDYKDIIIPEQLTCNENNIIYKTSPQTKKYSASSLLKLKKNNI